MTVSECPDCGAVFRPGAAVCPECGIELHEDDSGSAQDKLDAVVIKVMTALRAKFSCNDEAGIDSGFLLTDLADSAVYELHISRFDPQAWEAGR
jgi:hypothetical protein